MTALFRVELRRALARRLVRLSAIIVVAGIVLAGIITAARSHPAPDLPAGAQEQIESCVRGDIDPPGLNVPPEFREQYEDQYPPGSSQRRDLCSATFTPRGSNVFSITHLKGILGGTTGPLVVVALLIGASLIAAEWRSGNMATTLTWEPRRIRLMLTKLAVAVIVTVGFYLVMQALLAGVLWLVAITRGTMAGGDAAFAKSVAGLVLRAAFLIAFAATLGFSIGSIGKNTAAAAGAAFGYLMIFEQILFGLVAWLRPWLINANAIIFVSNEPLTGDVGESVGASTLKAGLRLGLYAVGLAAAATGLFKARDVSS